MVVNSISLNNNVTFQIFFVNFSHEYQQNIKSLIICVLVCVVFIDFYFETPQKICLIYNMY
jgi:hypothetical protein